MNYSTIKTFDISNGIGVRTSIFLSGCSIHCRGCFNHEAWSYDYGTLFTQATIDYILETLNSDNIAGLSILGGEPLDPRNRFGVFQLIQAVKTTYPDKDIWLWTGYLWDDLFDAIVTEKDPNAVLLNILGNVDIIVDGPFDENQQEVGLRFRGSANQRILDARASFEAQVPVLWHDDPLFDYHDWRAHA